VNIYNKNKTINKNANVFIIKSLVGIDRKLNLILKKKKVLLNLKKKIWI
jgi:hypothetical protein